MNTKQESAQQLLAQRTKLRQAKQFAQADEIRKQIEALGFDIIDDERDSRLQTRVLNKARKSFLLLFGSGETSSTGRLAHEYVFQQLQKPAVSIAIITSPAGFQPNVKVVHEEIADFFVSHLTNFHPLVKIIYANTPKDANNQTLIQQLLGVDYIFLGPGSPTYAIEVLKGSLLLQAILESYANGTSLCLASAAALAFSRFTLPIYEIYKVGSRLFWQDGLNAYKILLNQELSVIPHWNNNEGGKQLDTSCCYMGSERFAKLKKILPPHQPLLGIDEHTGLIVDNYNKQKVILGKGGINEITA